ncbi:MAG: DedA family protein [Patescibacteria group bacterium]|nr:DedA family protein [Patescibacteria group bacterium]
MLELPVLSALLIQYGYIGIFAGVIVGGEILLLASGFLAAQGYFNVFWVIFLATVAVILVDIIWYILGRFGEKALVTRLQKILIGKKEKTMGLDQLLKKHASKTILLVRFVYGVRAMVLILAGALRMHFGKFVLLNIIGSLVWATTMTLLGYFFGESWQVLRQYVQNSVLFVTLVFVIGIIVISIVMLLKKQLFKVVKEEEIKK